VEDGGGYSNELHTSLFKLHEILENYYNNIVIFYLNSFKNEQF